jgi:hypothetical protein
MGKYGKFWEIMGNFGKSIWGLWENLGNYGNFWEIMGRLGKLWEIGISQNAAK